MGVEEAAFRVDLRLILELGERLISRDEVAVVELVKNAYDADASEVLIEISNNVIRIVDDGHGMDIDKLKEGWFTIGTSIKKQNIITKKGRRVLGEKGLGRLALLRLGNIITLYTKTKDSITYKIIMDWKMSKNRLDEYEFTPLSDMIINIESYDKRNLFEKGHGTIIEINELNNKWDNRNIEKLKIFLSRLVEPQIEDIFIDDEESTGDIFIIKFISNDDEIIIEPPEIIRKPHYDIEIIIDEKGFYKGTLKWNMAKGTGEKEIEQNQLSKIILQDDQEYEWLDVKNGGCGGFKFQLNMWDLDAAELKGHRSTLRDWSGVSVFRDGFRVVQPDVDWLGLDLRRVQNPSLRFSTNQIIANVFITAENNPHLIDKTDREGVLENDAFYILEGSIYHFMNIIERERYKLRRKKTLTTTKIVDKLDSEVLKDIAKKLPKKEKEQLENFVGNLEDFKKSISEWMTGRDRLATMGLLVARLLHTARGELVKITDAYPLIEDQAKYFDLSLQRHLNRMVDGGKQLAKIFKRYDPLLRFTSRKREIINLHEHVENIRYIFSNTFKNSDIVLFNDVEDNLELRINPTDLYVILSNIIENSIYWLSNSDVEYKLIEIRSNIGRNYIEIEVADSGPGIDPEIYELIFEPGFSTKPNGTGMGLSIVNDLVEIYNGEISVNKDTKLNGAVFTIGFVLRRR